MCFSLHGLPTCSLSLSLSKEKYMYMVLLSWVLSVFLAQLQQVDLDTITMKYLFTCPKMLEQCKNVFIQHKK